MIGNSDDGGAFTALGTPQGCDYQSLDAQQSFRRHKNKECEVTAQTCFLQELKLEYIGSLTALP